MMFNVVQIIVRKGKMVESGHSERYRVLIRGKL